MGRESLCLGQTFPEGPLEGDEQPLDASHASDHDGLPHGVAGRRL
jgi:hypothetical protein